ncbi:MAG TPA: hypothetical protein VLW17_12885 [Thermoanaerobaculaceae bacterium]|nr:hypothetical protein [Thermoanaerobaculaceae bacterium]
MRAPAAVDAAGRCGGRGVARGLAGAALAILAPAITLGLPPGGADGRGPLAPTDSVSGRALPDDALFFLRLAANARSAAAKPHVDAALAPLLKVRLFEAYDLARRQVSLEPRCGALFGNFGAAGAESLARTRYRSGEGLAGCLRQAAAFTCVGCLQTVLCPAFSNLDTVNAAAILIHEALHQAGLPERPPTPDAMSSLEITRVVETSCAL